MCKGSSNLNIITSAINGKMSSNSKILLVFNCIDKIAKHNLR